MAKSSFLLNEENPRALIGRTSDCEIMILGQYLSRHHAVLIWSDGHVYVSFPPGCNPIPMNGLEVDGRSLLEDEFIELSIGSELAVGQEVIAKVCSLDADIDQVFPNVSRNCPEEEIRQLPGLKIIYWGEEGKKESYILNASNPQAVIGRTLDCDIIILGPYLSRHHAVLTWADGHGYVSFPPGCNPVNGLSVGGVNLLPNESIELLIGSELAVGNNVIAKICSLDDDVDLQNNVKDYSILPPAPKSIECMKAVYWAADGKKKTFFINEVTSKAIIGRGSDCQICVACSQLSEHHAILFWRGGHAFVMSHPDCLAPDAMRIDGKSLDNDIIEVRVGSELATEEKVFAKIGLPNTEVELKEDVKDA